MYCIAYQESHREEWDQFVAERSINATFLHSRKFLSYHKHRFDDCSLMIFAGDKLIGLFPAAIAPSSSDVVLSHPGITYGGLVVDGKLRGKAVIEAFSLMRRHYVSKHLKKMRIKLVPSIFNSQLYQDDIYAMFRLGGRRYRCDISATIDLHARRKLTKGRKYEVNKGKKNKVEVVEDIGLLNDTYQVLQDNLQREHAAKPVHSLDEIILLHERFPNDVRLLAAKVGGKVVAGVIMFNHKKYVAHTQYIASYPVAHEIGALDFLLETAITQFQSEGFRYFDFGISNEEGGLVLNENLYRYKRSFGAGGMVHEFYELDLEEG